MASVIFLRPCIVWPSVGSTPKIFISFDFSLKNFDAPINVPVVPIPVTKASIWPLVCS